MISKMLPLQKGMGDTRLFVGVQTHICQSSSAEQIAADSATWWALEVRIRPFPPQRYAGGVLSRGISHPDTAILQHLWSLQLIDHTNTYLIAEPSAVLLCNL